MVKSVNDGALYFRGCSKVMKGEIQEAVQDMSEAITINDKLIPCLKEESGIEGILDRLQAITSLVNSHSSPFLSLG